VSNEERRQNARMRAFLGASQEGFVVIDAEDHIRILNEAAASLLGVERIAVMDTPVSTLDCPDLETALADARFNGPWDSSTAVITARGRLLGCTLVPFEDAECDARECVAVVVRDGARSMGDLERAEAILDATGDGMLVFSPDGKLTYFNPAARDIVGPRIDDHVDTQVTLAEILGTEPLLPEGAESTGAAWEATLSEPERRIVQVRTSSVLDSEGAPIGTVSNIRDITAEREMAMMKNEFVSTVSHELRTPLTSIKGYVDLIVDGEAGEINEIQREFLEIVQENSDRLVSLINDMLDISRIESGRIHLKVEPIEITDLIAGAAETFKTMADQSSVELVTSVAEDLPRAAGDRDRVGQVLMNLVSNAIKYSPGGGTATITARRDGDNVVVEVSDTGIGIKPEDQAGLFSKFYRVDSSLTRDIGGTGLGLSICKSIVELLGGKIWAKSEFGEGSAFAFSLPVAPPDLVRTPAVEGPDTAAGTVLVVDRDPDVASLIETYLVKRGYDVLTAHSAQAATQLAAQHRPRAITLDVMLDDADGFDLLQQLKSHPDTSDIPVLVLSVVCDEGKSMRLGAANYLEKPVNQKRLVDVIDGLVGSVASPLVLVVDDDRDIVGSISRVLKARGFAVMPAYDGKEAMAAVRRKRPHLMLLDLRMPEMDGYQVIQEIKTDHELSDIPIVVMTAHRIDHSRMGIIDMAAEQVPKPFSAEEIVERVESLLAEEA